MNNIFAITAFLLISGCSINTTPPLPLIADSDQPPIINEPITWYPIQDTSVGWSSDAIEGNQVIIDGKTYYENSNGELMLTQSEVDTLKEGGAKVYNPTPVNGIKVDTEELTAMMQDQDALFAFLKNPNYRNPNDVSFVVKEGSLKDNFARLARNYNVNHFRWEIDYSYHVPATKVIVAQDIEDVINILVASYPIEASLDELSPNNSTLRIYSIDSEKNRIAFTVKEGSLEQNFVRLSKLAGWKDQWEFDYDFAVPRTQVIRGNSFKDILAKMLKIKNYPIVAEQDRNN